MEATSGARVLHRCSCHFHFAKDDVVVEPSWSQVRRRRGELVLSEDGLRFRSFFLTPMVAFCLLVLPLYLWRFQYTGADRHGLMILFPLYLIAVRWPVKVAGGFPSFHSFRAEPLMLRGRNGEALVLGFENSYLHFHLEPPLPDAVREVLRASLEKTDRA